MVSENWAFVRKDKKNTISIRNKETYQHIEYPDNIEDFHVKI